MTSRRDIVTGFAVLVVAALGFWETAGLPTEAALLPDAVLGLLALLALAMIARGYAAKSPDPTDEGAETAEPEPIVTAPRRLLIGITAMALYVAAIEHIGFYVSTLLFMPLTSLALGIRDIRVLAGSTVVFVGFAYAVFTVLFDRVLPQGLMFALMLGIIGAKGIQVGALQIV